MVSSIDEMMERSEELKKEFRPEFINRIDEIIIFNKLVKEDIIKIIDLMVKDMEVRLKSRNIKIVLTEEFKTYMVEKEIDLNYGARELKRKLQENIENEIAEKIINKTLEKNSKIIFDFVNNKKEVNIVRLNENALV